MRSVRPVRRDRLLERAAVAVGAAWAARWADEMATQGRPTSGGWPGTISEARALVVARVCADLGPSHALTSAELELMARTAYLEAKGRWLESAQPDSNP